MKWKHLFWIIPLCLIIGGFISLKLLSGLIDFTMVNLTERTLDDLIEYKNKTYMVCGYSASCPSNHIERWIGGECIECRPKNPMFDYAPINFSEICKIR